MTIAHVFPIVLISATLLCTLVTGFVLLFAIVVMPGIGSLSDREFLSAFQAIDGVIQNNQPLFLFTWIGSTMALILAAILGVMELEGASRIILLSAALVNVVGVQLPTVTVNIPLNHRLQTLDLDTDDPAFHSAERRHFEARWNHWNLIRTVFACLISILLLIVLRSLQ